MFDLKKPEIAFAMEAVRQAALMTQRVQDELVSTALTKEDKSPVTVADFAAQAVVGRMLSETFAQDVIIAEEDSQALREAESAKTLAQVADFVSEYDADASPKSVCQWIDHGRTDLAERFWTLDPIDGTKGFLRGEQYAIALALVEGQVQIGVLGCPNLVNGFRPAKDGAGSLIVAVRGQGTWTTPLSTPGAYERLYVSAESDPSQARLLRSVESGHTNVDQIDDFVRALAIQAAPVLMDSQAKYGVLAAGQAELLLRMLSPLKPNYKEKIWDQAAGALVLEEAGGQITDLDGKPLDFTTGRSLKRNRGVVASNKTLHEAALKALRALNA